MTHSTRPPKAGLWFDKLTTSRTMPSNVEALRVMVSGVEP